MRGAALAFRRPNALQAAGQPHAVKSTFLKMAAVLVRRPWWAVGLWKWGPPCELGVGFSLSEGSSTH